LNQFRTRLTKIEYYEAESNSNRREETKVLSRILKLKEQLNAVLAFKIEARKKTIEEVKRTINHIFAELNQEKERWESEHTTFTSQKNGIVGDAIISSAFQTYNGFCQSEDLVDLLTAWFNITKVANVTSEFKIIFKINFFFQSSKIAFSVNRGNFFPT